MKRYEVIGIPLSPPFDVLAGRAVGDQFDARIDEDVEQLLIGAGALRIVPSKPRPEQKKVEQRAKPVSESPSRDH